MLKRLIEVALPLKEVSEQSAREKSIRHGHISTLHIWWARRPLAACRAVVFASLKTGQIDSETRFYVLWKWSYADAKVPADEAFKLAQALGIGTESMWDRTGVLEKQGENVQALTTAKRMRINDLGEPNVDGSPAPLIDALHRCCAFRDKGDTGGLSEYLARSGHGRNEKLWTVAQAMSEVLPDGDKEKQLLQGLLNQRDKVEEEMKEGRLF